MTKIVLDLRIIITAAHRNVINNDLRFDHVSVNYCPINTDVGRIQCLTDLCCGYLLTYLVSNNLGD